MQLRDKKSEALSGGGFRNKDSKVNPISKWKSYYGIVIGRGFVIKLDRER